MRLVSSLIDMLMVSRGIDWAANYVLGYLKN